MMRAPAYRSLVIGVVLLGILAPMELRADRMLPSRMFFAESDILSVRLSPSGAWAVAVQHDGEFYRLMVQEIKDGFIETVFASRTPIYGYRWVDGNNLLLGLKGSRDIKNYIIELRNTPEKIEGTKTELKAHGWLEDPLLTSPDTVLWGFEEEGRTTIHRTTLDELNAYWAVRQGEILNRGSRARLPDKPGLEVARVRNPTSLFIVDASGTPRAALAYQDESVSLIYRDDGDEDFRVVLHYERDPDDDEEEVEWITPLALAPNGKGLLALAYGDRNTRSLYEFDVSKQKSNGQEFDSAKERLGRLVFGHEDVDLSDVLLDDVTKELIGVVYEVEGERKFHYFDAYRDHYLSGITDRFPNQDVAVTSSNADHTSFVLWTSGPTNPGTYFYHDRETGEISQIAERIHGVNSSVLNEVEVFEVTSRDGTRIEAFLALPDSTHVGAAPLVVIPHGGPIGVRDNLDFDPLQQYLASWGMAVLKINYRGSSGYGLEFEDAGKGEWSRGIEDDIDAAVEFAMKRPDIDSSRICIAGGSYGGYSALVSTLRHPDRYRCAASINGVTDILFLFESGDVSESKRALKSLSKIIGDPDKDRDAMIDISPLYRAEEFRVPLLFVYGTEDRRVNPDHSLRLMTMLDIFQKPYESTAIADASHSFDQDDWIIAANSLRKFLYEHLLSERALGKMQSLPSSD